MNLLDSFLARLGYAKAKGDPNPPAELLSIARGLRWEVPEAATAERQIRLYQQLTWIATAIDRTSEIAAGALFSVKQVAGEPGGADDADLPNHDYEKLMRRPNPSQSRGEFLRDSFATYRITGNLYWYLNRPSENVAPIELWIIPSTMIRPIPDGRSYVRGYEFTAPGQAAEFIEPWKIMHLKSYNPANPFVGLSAVQSLALDAYGDLAQQKFNLSMFDDNAGKMPGIIVFKDMVAAPMWKEIQEKRNSEWGKGSKQSGPMLLRGVGQNGVEYIQAQLSQKEMEFLEGRGFTRAEIYGKLAPGLDNILSINATEANAKVGERSLIKFGVWPTLVQLAEKITADILPLYGENLEGAFDDIRPTELAEEEKFFTINEIRQRRYKAPPLYLDESQVTALEEDMAQAEENNALALEQREQAQARVPAKFAPPAEKPAAGQPKPKAGKQLDPRGLMFVAQIGPATPLAGDATQPPPAPPMPPVVAEKPAPGKEGGEPDDAAKAAELEAWERFAVKRLGRGGREFEPRTLDVFTAGRIRTALKTARTADDVRRVFETVRGGDTLADAVAELRRFNDLAGPR